MEMQGSTYRPHETTSFQHREPDRVDPSVYFSSLIFLHGDLSGNLVGEHYQEQLYT